MRSERRSAFLRALASLSLGAAPFAALSCQSLAGIEDRELGPCGEYRDVVMQNCTEENAVYENREKCLGTCRLLEAGYSVEPQRSEPWPVGCARRAAPRRPSVSRCRTIAARPGREGIPGAPIRRAKRTAGSTSKPAVCSEIPTRIAWTSAAPSRDEDSFNANDDYEGDTLQCRLCTSATRPSIPAYTVRTRSSSLPSSLFASTVRTKTATPRAARRGAAERAALRRLLPGGRCRVHWAG